MNATLLCRGICLIFGLGLLVTAGCGGGSAADALIAGQNQSNMQRLCNLYGLYQAQHGWQGPADEAAFKSFISGQQPKTLERMGIDPSNIDALFASERDGQSFEILWSVAGGAQGDPTPIVFETTGVSGLREVGFLHGEPREVDETEYRQLQKSAASG